MYTPKNRHIEVRLKRWCREMRPREGRLGFRVDVSHEGRPTGHLYRAEVGDRCRDDVSAVQPGVGVDVGMALWSGRAERLTVSVVQRRRHCTFHAVRDSSWQGDIRLRVSVRAWDLDAAAPWLGDRRVLHVLERQVRPDPADNGGALFTFRESESCKHFICC